MNKKNIFNKPISNLNVIIGKNGVGKTTILNEIFDLLHGSFEKDRVVVLKKNKDIFIYVGDSKISLEYENKANEHEAYRFHIKSSGFYLNLEDTTSNTEVNNLIYISEFTDLSINGTAHRYEDNHAFNYSPFVLINSPNSFLSYSGYLNNTLQKSISNFRLISKIHQIDFLANEKFNFNFKKPTSTLVSFKNFYHNLERRFNSKFFKDKGYLNELIKNIIQREAKNSFKFVCDVHMILSLWNLLDISKEIIDKEKAKSYFKNVVNIDELLKERLENYNKELYKILLDFSIGRSSVETIYKDYTSLLSSTQISNFYSDINGEDISVLSKFGNIVQAYNYVTSISLQNLKGKSSVNLNLENAGEFLKRYLTLRDYTEFGNEISFCMPDQIEYFYNNERFYFSSGQEQLIRLFTYIHLSVKNIKEKQKSFIVLLDEPNNSFHPEMQKGFIKNLYTFLDQFKHCSFHIILTSHSPIITSDLTNNHIILLEQNDDGVRSIDKDKPKTFAQNIYNLYKESFFVEDGLIGLYADEILSKVYKQLSRSKEKVYGDSYIKEQEYREFNKLDTEIEDKKKGIIKISENDVESDYNDEEIRYYINEIGEPVIKKKFEDIYNRTTRISLINKINDDENLDSGVKEELISLILKQRGY